MRGVLAEGLLIKSISLDSSAEKLDFALPNCIAEDLNSAYFYHSLSLIQS